MRILGLVVLAATLSSPAWAQVKDSPVKAHQGVGVVKSVDAAKGSVMLAHEPIASLRWPAMTMKFIATDRKILEKLAPGKKVRFEFIQKDRDYILTGLN